jgi:hypothetical protein
MTKPVKISFMSTRKIVDGKKVKTKPQRVSFIAKVSPKQAKRNRELAKIEHHRTGSARIAANLLIFVDSQNTTKHFARTAVRILWIT